MRDEASIWFVSAEKWSIVRNWHCDNTDRGGTSLGHHLHSDKNIVYTFVYLENGGNQNGYPPFLILKTFIKKLNIKNMTALHRMIASCCCLGSDIRGALRASAIVAKDKIPSDGSISIIEINDNSQAEHTHCCNYLRLHAKLIGEASSKIGQSSFAITASIWYLSDMVEHMAACE